MFSDIRKNKLKTAYFFVYLIVYLIAVFIGVIIIHESAHFLAALAIGVPFNEIKVGLIGNNPGVTIPDRFNNAPLGIFHYAGGFSAALVLSGVYFLIWYRRYRKKPSFMTWAYGAITMMAIGIQLGQGYVEGRFHAAYMFYASSLFSVTSILEYGVVALAMYFHFQFFPIARIKK